MKINVHKCRWDGIVSVNEKENDCWQYGAVCDCCGKTMDVVWTGNMEPCMEGLDLCRECLEFLYRWSREGIVDMERLWKEYRREPKVRC